MATLMKQSGDDVGLILVFVKDKDVTIPRSEFYTNPTSCFVSAVAWAQSGSW